MFCLTLNILRPVKSGSSRRREQTMTLGFFKNLGFEVKGSVALTPNWLLDCHAGRLHATFPKETMKRQSVNSQRRIMEANTATLIVAGLGIGGTFGSGFVVQLMARRTQREQWIIDNRKQECRDLLTASAVAFLAITLSHRDIFEKGLTSPPGALDLGIRTKHSDTASELYRVMYGLVFLVSNRCRFHP